MQSFRRYRHYGWITLLVLASLLPAPSRGAPSGPGTLWIREAEISIPAATNGYWFEGTLALDGTTLVASTSTAFDAQYAADGIAIFERQQGSTIAWDSVYQTDHSSARDVHPLALHGDTLAIGYQRDGIVQLYMRNSTTRQWQQHGWLFPSSGIATIALSGDLLVLGHPAVNRASVYRRSSNTGAWRLSGLLDPELTGIPARNFGTSVAIKPDLSGEGADRILIGAPCSASDQACAGSASLYEAFPGQPEWRHRTTFSPSDGRAGDRFGESVAFSDETFVVGAPGVDIPSPTLAQNAGAVYVFGPVPGGWSQWRRLTATAPSSQAAFGTSLATAGTLLIVSAPYEALSESQSGSATGAVYGFVRDRGGPNAWGLVKRIVARVQHAGDTFGLALALSGNTLAVGAGSPGNPWSSGLVSIYRILSHDIPPIPTLSPPTPRLPRLTPTLLAADQAPPLRSDPGAPTEKGLPRPGIPPREDGPER